MALTSILEEDSTPNATTGTGLELIIERSALLKALSHVQSVVEKRNTIAILSNVKLDASSGSLTLTATDMDLAISEIVDADIRIAGAVTTPAHMFYDIVRKLPDGGQVALSVPESDPGKMTITCGSCKFSLPCLPAADFPVMDESGMTHNFSIPANEFKALIDKTRFAMSTEETRYYLNGIYLHTPKNSPTPVLRTVATDGHRLARIEVALPEGASNIPGIIIPRKTVSEVKRLIEDGLDVVSLSLSASKIRFAYGNIVLLSKLIDGTFPDYENVIPVANDKIMEIDSKLFTRAVDRVSTVSAEKTSGIKFTLDHGQLTLSASSDGNGTATEEVEANYSAGKIEIGFNARYLLEMMSVIEGDVVQFVLADSASPAIARDAADMGALFVIMPMRV
jgi:DNA polymerase III subunit beta